MLAILGLAGAFVLDQSRPSELLERPRNGEAKIFVDAVEVLIALLVLGVGAIVVVGVASWAISRRAVQPLGDALRIQRAFVADASHELRTPLAVLDTRLQVLQRQLDRGEPARGTAEAARNDVKVMVDLVTDLLLVAESAAIGGDGEGSDLRPVVLASVEDLRVLAAERDVAVLAEVVNEARVPVSEPSLRRAVTVLIDNAVAHSPDRATVHVTAGLEGRRAVIRVRDEGIGVIGLPVGQVFDRFAHGPDNGGRRGFGIGLALVRDLVVRHGGTVQVESTSATGTVMRVELPVGG